MMSQSVNSKLQQFLGSQVEGVPSTSKHQILKSSRKEEKQRNKSKSQSRVRFDQEVTLFDVEKGVQKLNKLMQEKVYVDTMQTIIEVIFDDDYEEKFQNQVESRKKHRLMKLVTLKEKLSERNNLVLWSVFIKWKRLDYIQMLDSLQQFKMSLDKIYSAP